MHFRDWANRPEPIKPLREDELTRDTDVGPTGNIAEAGYERIARRPRSRMSDEIVPEERADRTEGLFADYPPFGMD